MKIPVESDRIQDSGGNMPSFPESNIHLCHGVVFPRGKTLTCQHVKKSKGKKTVLLLNPPGKELFIRDLFCSLVSKTGYLWHPADLLVQSGIISQECEVVLLDAIADRVGWDSVFRVVRERRPDCVLFLSSSQSEAGDILGMTKLKKLSPSTLVVGTGESFLGNPGKAFSSHEYLDAILYDFTSGDVLKLINKDSAGLESAVMRNGPHKPPPRVSGSFTIPFPRHDLFTGRKYRHPFNVSHPFTSLVTDFGCAFKCAFCNNGFIGYKTRDCENVREELAMLGRAGYRQLCVRDLTFGINRDHAEKVCSAIRETGCGFTWNCYSRVDVIDDEFAGLMASSGCRLVQFGVEVADQALLKKLGKPVRESRVFEAFESCRKYGMRTGAHFILGLPGETPETRERTRRLALELAPDYISVNIFRPRRGSTMHGMPPPAQAGRLRAESRRMQAQFYLRPSYLLGQLSRMESLEQFKGMTKDGFGLMWRTLARGVFRDGGRLLS
jgi:anaerobic magnesium-protoporphyrin IX monomethyl ester cyclase